MKIFIINLKKDISRRKYIEGLLSPLNVSYEFFEGTYGKDLSEQELEKFIDFIYLKEKKQEWTLGEIGCALSHYRNYKKIIDEKIDKALIMEDDIFFEKDIFLKAYGLLMESSKWEYASLNYDTFNSEFREKYLWKVKNLGFWGKIKKGTLILVYRPIELFQQVIGRRFGPFLMTSFRPLHLTGCYAITYEGAKKIIKTQGEKIKYLADYCQNEAKNQYGLQLYFISPLIGKQENEKFGSNTRNE